MKNKNFEEIIATLKENNSNEINDMWQQAKLEKRKTNKIFINTCLIVDIILMYIIYDSIKAFYLNDNIGIINILVFLIMFIIIDFIIYIFIDMIFNKKQKEYKQLFKEVIIRELISNFYDNLIYLPMEKMPNEIYNEAKYDEYYNRYNSEDYIKAKIDSKYQLNMAEIKTQQLEEYTDSEGNIHRSTKTIFYGIFSKIVIDKSINSELKIKRNGSYFFNNKRLEMDSGQFEKYFDVYATNQIIGMQLLTADIMEILIDFQNKNNIKYDIIINNNVIYLRFHCGNVFEAGSIKENVFNEKNLKKYYNILKFTYELSNKIIETIKETEI